MTRLVVGSRPSRTASSPLRVRGALVLLLALHAGLAVTSLWRTSVTIDESAHLPAGLSYWQTGSFALYHHNPPLLKMMTSLPVLLSRPAVVYDGSWARAREAGIQPSHVDFAAEFMRVNAARYFDLFRRARIVVVLLSLAGALLVYSWGRDLWGPSGGLLAAALWSLDPNVLAHAGVATTDIGGTVAIFAATYAFWRYLRAPSWPRALASGLLLGCAQLAKFSALILYPLFPLIALLHHLGRRSGDRAPMLSHAVPGTAGAGETDAKRYFARALLIPALSLLVINLGYLFEGTGRAIGGFPFLSTELTVPRRGDDASPPYHPNAFYRKLYQERQNRFAGGWLANLPAPLPAHYILGFDEQRFESHIGLPGGGYAVYLNGTIRRDGWLSYYLEALALKVPLGTWLLGVAALLGAAFLPELRLRFGDEAAWALPAAAVVVCMSLMTGLDLGVRYILPMFPFACVGIARLVRLFTAPRRHAALAATCLLTVSLSWNVLETIFAWPHFLAYFNEAAGGPEGGHRYLLDSNLDWGQDLLELRRWLDTHPRDAPIALAYFGTVDPGIAGISFRLPPRDPRGVAPDRRLPGEIEALRPGTYAVSVNFVQGLPHRVLGTDGEVVPVDEDAFGYFRLLRPRGRAGRSIWIYRLDERDIRSILRLWGTAASAPRD